VVTTESTVPVTGCSSGIGPVAAGAAAESVVSLNALIDNADVAHLDASRTEAMASFRRVLNIDLFDNISRADPPADEARPGGGSPSNTESGCADGCVQGRIGS
jgi:hypothetical protein